MINIAFFYLFLNTCNQIGDFPVNIVVVLGFEIFIMAKLSLHGRTREHDYLYNSVRNRGNLVDLLCESMRTAHSEQS